MREYKKGIHKMGSSNYFRREQEHVFYPSSYHDICMYEYRSRLVVNLIAVVLMITTAGSIIHTTRTLATSAVIPTIMETNEIPTTPILTEPKVEREQEQRQQQEQQQGQQQGQQKHQTTVHEEKTAEPRTATPPSTGTTSTTAATKETKETSTAKENKWSNGRKTKTLLDFVIAGFDKCGTTFLLNKILYPSKYVNMGGKKEIHLLDEPINEHDLQQFIDIYRHDDDDDDDDDIGKSLTSDSMTSLLHRTTSTDNEQSVGTNTEGKGQIPATGENRYHDNNNSRAFSTNNTTNVKKNGFKSPRLLKKESALRNLEMYFPDTKFIVTLRHPVWRFQSWYNFKTRISFERDMSSLPPPHHFIGNCGDICEGNKDKRVGSTTCVSDEYSGCTGDANYHHFLSRLGLTAMDSKEELSLLDHHNWSIHRNFSSTSLLLPGDDDEREERKLFLIELGQMEGENLTVTNQVIADLAQYLDLDSNALPRIRSKYTTKNNGGKSANDKTSTNGMNKKEDLVSTNSNKKSHFENKLIDICNDEYSDIREVLVESGRKASIWIEKYLLMATRTKTSSSSSSSSSTNKSPMGDSSTDSRNLSDDPPNQQVVWVSQREDFLTRIRQWQFDPCHQYSIF